MRPVSMIFGGFGAIYKRGTVVLDGGWYEIRTKSVRDPYEIPEIPVPTPVPTPYQPRTNPVRAYGVRTRSARTNPVPTPYVPFGGSYDTPPLKKSRRDMTPKGGDLKIDFFQSTSPGCFGV